MVPRLLAALLVAALAAPAAASAEPTAVPARVAVLNWGLAQTVTALGVEPVAVANVAGYRKWVAAPPLPEGTVDLGRRIEPNLDVLAGTAPDLILTSGYFNRGRDRLASIAPTETLRIFRPGGDGLERALEVAGELAARLDRPTAMSRLQRDLDEAIERLGARSRAGESVYVISFRDGGHVRVYGRHGLFDGVLRRAGLDNAWDGATNFWGFSLVPIERLDAAADHVVVVEPVNREAQEMMRDSPVWRALPAVRSGRVHRIAPTWSYGGVPAAIRFADLLGAAIDDDR